MGTFFDFLQIVFRTANHDFMSMVDKRFDQIFQIEQFGTPIHQRDIIDAEGRLQCRHLI